MSEPTKIKRVDTIEERLRRIENVLDRMDRHLESLDKRIDHLLQRAELQEGYLSAAYRGVLEHDSRIRNIEDLVLVRKRRTTRNVR